MSSASMMVDARREREAAVAHNSDTEGGDGLDLLGVGEEGFGFDGALDGVGGYFFSVGDGHFADVFRAYGDGGGDWDGFDGECG